jgi:hypothetical protein
MEGCGFEVEGGEWKPYIVVEDARLPEAGARGRLVSCGSLLHGATY